MNKALPVLVVVVITAGVAVMVAVRNVPPQPLDLPVATQPDVEAAVGTRLSAEPKSPIRFALVPGSQTGINFEYYGSPSDEHYMTEQNGGGIAILDFDNDERPDLFFSNGSHFQRPAQPAGASQRLYRAFGAFEFEDVTKSAGLEAFGFGQGCAAGDFDNDGFCDLFVAHYGKNQLWHNNGDGTFVEVAQPAGVDDDHWASSAAFADLDRDGQLDLYVANYVDWTPASQSQRRIPSPMDFDGKPDLLYRNLGNGLFQEVGGNAGIAIEQEGKGLAVAISDLDGDQLLDIYVANDTTRNFLFHNRGELRFAESGVADGVAQSQDGSIGSSMGIAICDYNHDLLPDMFVTNFAEELVDAFTNLGPVGFAAGNQELGLDHVARRVLNFGIVAEDFDLDTWPDLFFANGHLWDETAAGGQYKMHPSLLRNRDGVRFIDVADQAGEYFTTRWLGRAVAVGDLDNDGDADLVVGHLLDPPAVLRNDSDRVGGSLRVQFIGRQSARQPLGARVEVLLDDGQRLVTQVPAGGSFQASHDPVVIISTGTSSQVAELSICWTNGKVEVFRNLPNTQTVRLIEGHGEPAGRE